MRRRRGWFTEHKCFCRPFAFLDKPSKEPAGEEGIWGDLYALAPCIHDILPVESDEARPETIREGKADPRREKVLPQMPVGDAFLLRALQDSSYRDRRWFPWGGACGGFR